MIRISAFADKVYWSSGSFSDCVAVYLAYKTWHSRVLMSRNKTDQEDKRWCQHHHLQRKVYCGLGSTSNVAVQTF